MQKNSFVLFLILFLSIYLKAQDKPQIKSIQLWSATQLIPKNIFSISEPFILKFDDLDDLYKDFQYQIVHYTPEWEPSNLRPADYIIGLQKDYINNYAYSVGALETYIHYRINFPNQNTKFKLSGNYGIKIFIDSPKKPIFEKRFCIYENIVNVSGTVSPSRNMKVRDSHQDVEFNVNSTPNFDVNRNLMDMKFYITQNQDLENIRGSLTPRFVKKNQITFGFKPNLTFQAWNEYRWFEVRNFNNRNTSIDKFIRTDSLVHTILKLDIPNKNRGYTQVGDLNGQYVVRTDDLLSEFGTETKADYTVVNFGLEIPKLENESIYVIGNFNGFQLTEENKMVFNEKSGYYEANILLKQGYYDYRYFIPNQLEKNKELEGSYWATENEYNVLVYFKGWRDLSYKLIGYRNLNSRALFNSF